MQTPTEAIQNREGIIRGSPVAALNQVSVMSHCFHRSSMPYVCTVSQEQLEF